jgi:hypothetical protein
MQAVLLTLPVQEDLLWKRAAYKECIAYGEHGRDLEIHEDGSETCFNCGGAL